ncbi:asparaginyl-tRNA synthetase family protein, putative [Babesia bigemina]|uniref:asparagine--tRNA ligase n=1 Tax=Babesia bigemina TaxID=5866 RepID=A0A061D0W5_BABBI|nr:asparaginyl-tRNA synthetase family protein, putative [Babesia bigemina]CDR93767.1 asparaginyl-tRNA synthetase family protein, putative [Babesia bigemina]|eukprot:XP_012765953.1 asparaginyl-tRNA synthetase family protein, putative [Babesia bigemina]
MVGLTTGAPTAALMKLAEERSSKTLESTQPRYERIGRLLTILGAASGGNSRVPISVHLSDIYGKTKLGDVYDIHSGMRPIKHAEFEALRLGTSAAQTELPTISVAGWCKTVRMQNAGKLGFVIINDGSCKADLQVIVHEGAIGHDIVSKCTAGTTASVKGILVERPPKAAAAQDAPKEETLEAIAQKYEVHVCSFEGHRFEIIGENRDAAKYPIAKKYITHEFLREVAHLRPRSYFISAVMRVRSALAMATHTYFQRLGCIYLSTPLITTTDCEGAGELFQVTTILEGCRTMGDLSKRMLGGDAQKAKTLEEMELDFKKDFFKRRAFLTCSGQLSAENYTCAMGKVYTFGPAFRAEHSHTYRHLAEFWMVEPEIDFCDLPKNMEIAEEYIKFCIQYALDHCLDDIMYLESIGDAGLVENLRSFVRDRFARITYTDVIDILLQHEADFKAGLVSGAECMKREDGVEPQKTAFENPVYWGVDLSSEHERFIAEVVFKKPTIIYNYPSKIKAFYMRRNDDGRTCAAMDVIVPQFGELVGGSQREERPEVLEASIKENGLNAEDYSWYMDLRTYGSIPHSGFGLGFERLVMLVTGVANIRDAIPFPRYVGKADF